MYMLFFWALDFILLFNLNIMLIMLVGFAKWEYIFCFIQLD